MNLSGNDFNVIPVEISSMVSLTSIDFTLNKIESLCNGDNEILLPKSITKLKMRSNKLDNIEYITELENLEEVYLDSNRLRVLPSEISKLKNLRILHLYINSIKYLPEDIGHLSSLRDLDISMNRIVEIPDSFSNLNSLNLLYAHSNQISSLNDDLFKGLTSLSQIILSNNKIKKLPSSINHASMLFSLDINQNKLKNFPTLDGIKLGSIDLGNNNLKQMPSTLYDHEYIVALNVFGNQIKSIHDSISNLKNLRKINLSYNHIQNLPESFTSLQELAEINLSGNKMKTIPNQIFSLIKLRILSLSNNQIKDIHEDIKNLSQLKDLHLEVNEIKSLESLYSLSSLEELNVSHNRIESIGKDITKLTSLQWFDISGNLLSEIDLDYMPSLTHIKILFNNIIEKPLFNQNLSIVDSGNPYNQKRFKKKKNKLKLSNSNNNNDLLNDEEVIIDDNNNNDNNNNNNENESDSIVKNNKSNSNSSLSNSGGSPRIYNYRQNFGWAETRGRRPEMQDSLVLEHRLNQMNIDLFGLFDGHAGSESADLCSSILITMMEKSLNNFYNNDRNIEDLKLCMNKTMEYLHQEVVKNNYVDGTAALIGLIIDHHDYIDKVNNEEPLLVIANSGDQRIVLCDGDNAINLTKDHKPDDVGELNRIKSGGGFVSENKRVNGILALSRAVGDVSLQPHVTYEPQVVVVTIKEEMEFIIIACDGLWDVISSEMAVKIVKEENDPVKAAVILKDYAYSLGSTDNISVIVYRFKKPNIRRK